MMHAYSCLDDREQSEAFRVSFTLSVPKVWGGTGTADGKHKIPNHAKGLATRTSHIHASYRIHIV